MSADVLLHLIRHGRPTIDPGTPAGQWPLADSGVAEIELFRRALPRSTYGAAWYCSDEIKAVQTAALLTSTDVTVLPELREAGRRAFLQDQAAFTDAVGQGLRDPARAARPGWEPLGETQERVSDAVQMIIARDVVDVVLVGHGTAWTLLVADLVGVPADPAGLPEMSTPDLLILDLEQRRVVSPWGAWQRGSEAPP